MTVTERINRFGKISFIQRVLSEDEEVSYKKQLAARRNADKEAQRQYDIDHRKGYCPKCRILLPLSGICDIHG